MLSTTKCTPDLQPLSEAILPFLRKPQGSEQGPTIVLIQNGIDIEEEVHKRLVRDLKLALNIISCTAWCGTNLVEGGSKIEHGALERLDMGLYPTPNGTNVVATEMSATFYTKNKLAQAEATFQRFVEMYNRGRGTAGPQKDIQPGRWRKVLWNAAFGGQTALARLPVAEMLRPATLEYTVAVARKIMLEILYVARSAGYSEEVFPAASIDETIEMTVNLYAPKSGTPPDDPVLSFKPSILLDLEAGRPMEIVPIFESIVRRAREAAIETPRLDMIVAALRPAQETAIRLARSKYGTPSDTTGSEASKPARVVLSGLPVRKQVD